MNDSCVSDVRALVREHGTWLYGDDFEGTVADWASTKLPVERMDEWIKTGCFDAACAAELEALGLDPADVGRLSDEDGIRLGYAFANHDVSAAEAVRRVKEVK